MPLFITSSFLAFRLSSYFFFLAFRLSLNLFFLPFRPSFPHRCSSSLQHSSSNSQHTRNLCGGRNRRNRRYVLPLMSFQTGTCNASTVAWAVWHDYFLYSFYFFDQLVIKTNYLENSDRTDFRTRIDPSF